jgi:DNA-binding XRE family transcriptional regulator
MIDTRKFKALMVEHGITQAELAQSLHCSRAQLNRKINNKVDFKQSEISDMATVFPRDKVMNIFFGQ